jgi:Ser/Thr protein kinase RdoA (MazF antagonist)
VTPESRQAAAFFLPGPSCSLEPLGNGNVNDTWLLQTEAGKKFVLQRLNPAVFSDPGLVQSNLQLVCQHLAEKRPAPPFTFLQLLSSPDGAFSYIDPSGGCWRLLSYIDNSQTLNSVCRPEQAYSVGAGLGRFHQLIADLEPASLADPLPGFHITPCYLEQYMALLPGCENQQPDCRGFIEQRQQLVFILEKARKQGIVSQQVIHGDPKIANFLFAANSSKVISLIDLDTVKPGLLLHDLGDGFRSCCNPLGEEVMAAEDVVFEPALFAAMLAGYCSTAASLLKDGDRQLLIDSIQLISFELGLRFYTDHLQGNPYFKVQYPNHNLFRARIQFALVRSIENQYTVLKEIQTLQFS